MPVELVGAGTVGEVENVFVPLIVSVPARCTTLASSEFTYCIDTGCVASPDPGVVRTAARFTAVVETGTSQYSVFTSPGPS